MTPDDPDASDDAETPRAKPELEETMADVSSPAAKAAAVDQAFNYRGDVTITLASGANVVGYVFNRDASAAAPFLEMYVDGERIPMRLAFEEIVGLRFSGRDTAAGKSWQAWLEKVKQAKSSDQADF